MNPARPSAPRAQRLALALAAGATCLVALTDGALELVAGAARQLGTAGAPGPGPGAGGPDGALHLSLLLLAAGLATAAVAAGGGRLARRLPRSDGAAVAALLGGEELAGEPRDPAERRLVELVEALVTAVDLPVPRLFVLPGAAPEVLAVGDDPRRAALAVSRGALERLPPGGLARLVARALGHALAGGLAVDLRLLRAVAGLGGLDLAGRAALQGRRSGPAGWAEGALGLGLCVLGAPGALAARLVLRLALRREAGRADPGGVATPDGLAGLLRRVLEPAGSCPGAAAPSRGQATAAPASWAVRLAERAAPASGPRWPWITGVVEVQDPCRELLAALAEIGDEDPAGAAAALEAGLRALGLADPRRTAPRPGRRPGVGAPAEALGRALPRLDRCSPAVKLRILEACLATVHADGRVTADEAAVVRAVAGVLGVAAPPLAPGPVPPLTP